MAKEFGYLGSALMRFTRKYAEVVRNVSNRLPGTFSPVNLGSKSAAAFVLSESSVRYNCLSHITLNRSKSYNAAVSQPAQLQLGKPLRRRPGESSVDIQHSALENIATGSPK